MNWNAIAAIGQFLETLVVLGGIPLVWWQLKQLRAENKLVAEQIADVSQERLRRKWEALTWALEVTTDQDFDEFFRELTSGHILTWDEEKQRPSKVSGIVPRLSNKLEVIWLAIEQGYLDRDLYFRVHGLSLINLLIPDSMKFFLPFSTDPHSIQSADNHIEFLMSFFGPNTAPGKLAQQAAEWYEKNDPYGELAAIDAVFQSKGGQVSKGRIAHP